MNIKEYVDKNYSDDVIREPVWRGRTLLVRDRVENSPLLKKVGVSVYVLGFCEGKEFVSGGIKYKFEAIPSRLQKNCRAFLRGIDIIYVDNIIRFEGRK